MSERILIWGAGAIGGVIGASLARSGHDITFVDIVAEHVQAIADPARGLRITGPVEEMTIVAPASTPDSLQGSWSRIFLAVKAQHTGEACVALLPHLADDGYVVSLQNGLCEHLIAEIVGPARTIGAFVNFGADYIAPGEILYGNRGAVAVGELDGALTARVGMLHRDLQQFEPDAVLTRDIFSYLWGKMAYASLLYAQALGDLGIADCIERPELLGLWRELAGEILAVAAAEGVEPLGFNGFDPMAFQPGASQEFARRSVAAMVAFNRPNAKTHSGVWRDLAVRRRRTEVDMHMGMIAEIGRRHGLACPRLERLVRMIHQIEDGARALSDLNLDELAA